MFETANLISKSIENNSQLLSCDVILCVIFRIKLNCIFAFIVLINNGIELNQAEPKLNRCALEFYIIFILYIFKYILGLIGGFLVHKVVIG